MIIRLILVLGLGVQPKTTPLDFVRIDIETYDPKKPTKPWRGLHFNAQALNKKGDDIDTSKDKFAAYVAKGTLTSDQWQRRFDNYLLILQRDDVTATIVWDAWKNGRQPTIPN